MLAKPWDQMPIYVTRDTNRVHGRLWINIYAATVILTLAVVNAIGWGVYGAVELVQKVV